MKEKKKADVLLKTYLRWPLFFIVLFAAAAIAASVMNLKAGIAVGIIALIGIISAAYLNFVSGNLIMKSLVEFAMSAESTEHRLSTDLDIPCALMDERGNFNWRNNAMKALTEKDKAASVNLNAMFADLDIHDIGKIEKSADFHSSYGDRRFRIRILKTEIGGVDGYAAYLEDETELLYLKKENEDRMFVAGLIYMDNYDEAMESVEEVRRSLLTALIDRKIAQYIDSMNGIVKKLEKDKYFFVTERKHLQEMQADRFDILEQVKTVNIGNEMRITLSIGIGDGGETYEENYEFARLAMDMALGRGGDQAVINNH